MPPPSKVYTIIHQLIFVQKSTNFEHDLHYFIFAKRQREIQWNKKQYVACKTIKLNHNQCFIFQEKNLAIQICSKAIFSLKQFTLLFFQEKAGKEYVANIT